MLLSWIKGLFGGSITEPAARSTPRDIEVPREEELFDEFRSYISREIASGFASPEDALETAIEIMSDDLDPKVLKLRGPAILAEELAIHVKDQAGWPEITDCDRLDSAFEALEEQGIVARQNFSCCGTCGSSEIWDEMENARNAGKLVRGYTFFHMQDTESAVDGCGLYLNYGSIDEGEKAAIAVGHVIQRELEKSGFSTNWDGDLGKRIGVSLDWKKRVKQPARDRLH
jgi:hypothetical protein